MNDYAIEARQVSKSYASVLALDKVDLHVETGSIYGLIGDNGAGKSTFLKLLAGHIFPSAGEVLMFGQHEEKDLCRIRQQTGVMIERPGYFPNLTVEQNLEYYRIQRGIPGRTKVEEMLQLTGLREKRKSKCKKLSLGQKQRLGLAIAMIGEPRLLILDEPTNGLDPSGIVEFRSLLKRLNEEKLLTILLSSHILPELQQTATHFGFLCRGRLLEELSSEALHEKCSDYLDIAVSDPEVYAALLTKHFPEESFRVLPDRTVQITRCLQEPEAYGRLATDNGLYIRALERHKSTLEAYYLNLKNGGNETC